MAEVLKAELGEVLRHMTLSSKPQAGQRPGDSASVWDWHSLMPRARRRCQWYRIQKGRTHPEWSPL